jgi:hypothetical protein
MNSDDAGVAVERRQFDAWGNLARLPLLVQAEITRKESAMPLARAQKRYQTRQN